MKLEDQALSIEQVRELQELGFDVEKYASMCWLLSTNEVNSFYPVNKQFWDAVELKYIPTLTIGDIIEILPEEIIVKDEDCNLFTYEFNIIKNSIYYYEFDMNDDIYSSGINKTFIDAFFETLKWCIKEKHIKI